MLKPHPLLDLALLHEDTGTGFLQGACVWLRVRGTGHHIQRRSAVCRTVLQFGGVQEDLNILISRDFVFLSNF